MSPSMPSVAAESKLESDVERDEKNDRASSGVLSPLPGALVINGDAALEILGDGPRREFTEAEDAAVLRKIDLWIMPVVLMVYFLQQLDKSSLSYTSVFGIVESTHLVGTQYSWLSSIVYVAQLFWQPMSSYFLVKLPLSKYLAFHVFMWGVCVAAMSAATNFKGLIAARFFLGLFEATVAPCFITITQMWWRRREQTFRLAMWMAMNGGTGMVGSLLSYGLGQIKGKIHPYQTIFLFIGLLTLVLSPIVYFVLPDSPTKARFLSHDEKIIALERLRANNQGTEAKVWKWDQKNFLSFSQTHIMVDLLENAVWECALDPKSYLWFALLFLCAVPSGGIGAFGPLIIQGFGFNPLHTILFNIPFAAFQVIITLLSAAVSMKIKLKWPIIFFLTLPPIAGASALYTLGRGKDLRNELLGCYYVLSFFTAIQPMLYTWASQNSAGHTKKICTTGIFFAAQCVGNIVGPLLYKTQDKPYYRPGLVADLICWVILSALTLVTAAYLAYLNRQHEAKRIRLGKLGVVVDSSLQTVKEKNRRAAEQGDEAVLNEQAFYDLTDLENEDFIYAL